MRNPKGSTSTSKTKTPCCSKIGIKRGPWTPEEDEVLANFIKKEGEGQWRTLPHRAGLLRCGKSCRLRWMNYLRPCVKKGRIAPDEEDLILRLHRLLGNRWSLIAGRIPGRTDNEIKNYWNSHLSKKLISQGIDPKTHKPLKPKPTSSIDPPNQSSIPISFPFDQSIKTYPHRAIATKVSESFNMANLEKFQNPIDNDGNVNWANYDGFSMELQCGHGQNGENYMGNDGFEESFSSILDSLINESVLVNHQQYQPNDVSPVREIQPKVSSPQTLNHNTNWVAEFMYSVSGSGGENGDLNDNFQASSFMHAH